MNLQVESDVANQAGHVPSKAKGLVHGSISALHVQNDIGVIDNTQTVSDFGGHGNDLRSGVNNIFDFFFVVHQHSNGPNGLCFLGNGEGDLWFARG